VTGGRLARTFWIGAAAILVAAALVSLAAVLRGDFDDTDGRILGTLASTLLAGSTLVAGLALVERGRQALGWIVVAVSAPGFAMLTYAIWHFVFDGGDDDSWRWGWTGALLLVAALVAAAALLLARTERIVRLAGAAAALATAASAVSVVAIWQESPGGTIGKTIAVLWILAGLCFLLVPVLQRFAAAGPPSSSIRVLARLDGVEIVAARGPVEGVQVDLPAAGEHLVLRRRT
jgi:hypothetical protein